MSGRRNRPISIAIVALGGQGGGVLTRWLVDVAEACGHVAQSTFVAGVAQRTGATVYCVELFPQSDLPDDDAMPVFTPYPVPGDVDLVVAGEITEAGRAIQKGFVTPNVTTLVASTHRVYSIEEKVALGNGIVDQQPVHDAAMAAARQAVLFDMQSAADEAGAVISAVLLGAIAGSDALPFARDAYEKAIRRDGRAVEANLRGFAAGYEGGKPAEEPATVIEPAADGPKGEQLLANVAARLPQPVVNVAGHGVLRALEYQDVQYAELYLERVVAVADIDSQDDGYRLTAEVARLLALQMCYEDTIRVAELKTRNTRFERVREHLNTGDTQIAYITEYFHPRLEEVCDTLPAGFGRYLLDSPRLCGLLAPLFRKGRMISTNKVGGFLLLSALSRLRRWRRGTLRYSNQTAMIERWLGRVTHLRTCDYEASLAMASCIEIVRGYGDTWQRGYERYEAIAAATENGPDDRRADRIRRLRSAALADEEGTAFSTELGNMETA